MYDVITIGTATRDVFLKTPDFKVFENADFSKDMERFRTGRAGCFMLGTKLEVPEVAITTGGGGVNTAVSFARQGLKTGCSASVGKDSVGREILDELAKEGVDSFLRIDEDHKTAYSTILVAEGGERTILEYRGANDFMSEKGVDWKNLKTKWVYIGSLAGNLELLAYLLEWASEIGAKVAFNPGKRLIKYGVGLRKFLDNVDVFFANESESAYLAEIEYEQEKEPEIFAELDNVVKGIVVMTKGARGVEVSDGEHRFTAGIPDSPVVDRTGAGDSFGSGFISAYIHSGGDIGYAIQVGTANATSVVQYFGAKEGLLKKDEWGDYPKVKINKTKI